VDAHDVLQQPKTRRLDAPHQQKSLPDHPLPGEKNNVFSTGDQPERARTYIKINKVLLKEKRFLVMDENGHQLKTR
jgi:hypothetical protein